MIRRVVGCMTGTSIDALDVALVEIRSRGPACKVRYVAGHSRSLGELQPRLRALAGQQPLSAGEIARLTHEFSEAHAAAILELLKNDSSAIDLIAAHGQTVFHAPPLSWQMIQPALLAAAFECPVISDLRAADIAQGGQGAPITPLADYVLLRGERPRAVLNLGGFCNVTLLPAVPRETGAARHDPYIAEICGGDLCPCNHLLDGLARRCLGRPYDEDGRVAAAGRADEAVVRRLVEVMTLLTDGRSLGTGDELQAEIEVLAGVHAPGTLLRSACAALAEAIVSGVQRLVAERRCAAPVEWLLAGGGTRNETLLAEIRPRAASTIALTDDFALPGAYREAAGMAVLGALCMDGYPITLPRVTHAASAPLSGAWSPSPRGRRFGWR